MARRTGSLEEEVARLMARSTRVDECLMVPQRGYGDVNYNNGSRMKAHRASYIAHNGPIPEGLVVRHTCDNKGCIEPRHLLIGTVLDNARDAVERGRLVTGMRHHFARVSPDQIRETVAEYLAGGVSREELARRLGVAPSTVGRWVRAESRLDVGLPGVVVGRGSRIATGLKPCGTRAGRDRHRRFGEPACDPCVQADRAYMRAYKAQRRAARRVWVGAL